MSASGTGPARESTEGGDPPGHQRPVGFGVPFDMGGPHGFGGQDISQPSTAGALDLMRSFDELAREIDTIYGSIQRPRSDTSRLTQDHGGERDAHAGIQARAELSNQTVLEAVFHRAQPLTMPRIPRRVILPIRNLSDVGVDNPDGEYVPPFAGVTLRGPARRHHFTVRRPHNSIPRGPTLDEMMARLEYEFMHKQTSLIADLRNDPQMQEMAKELRGRGKGKKVDEVQEQEDVDEVEEGNDDMMDLDSG